MIGMIDGAMLMGIAALVTSVANAIALVKTGRSDRHGRTRRPRLRYGTREDRDTRKP